MVAIWHQWFQPPHSAVAVRLLLSPAWHRLLAGVVARLPAKVQVERSRRLRAGSQCWAAVGRGANRNKWASATTNSARQSALSSIPTTTLGAKWCKQQVDEHPEWVPYLASLFRRGTFETMLKEDVGNKAAASQQRNLGKLLHARIKRVEKLPMSLKADFLERVNSTIVASEWEDGAIDQACRLALLSDNTTPLPSQDMFRYTHVVLDGMMARYMEVGQPLKIDFSDKTPTAEDFAFWSVDSSGDRVKFAMGDLGVNLPGSMNDMGWELSDPLAFACQAVSTKFKGCSVNLADSLERFAELGKSVGDAWGFEADSLQQRLAAFSAFKQEAGNPQ